MSVCSCDRFFDCLPAGLLDCSLDCVFLFVCVFVCLFVCLFVFLFIMLVIGCGFAFFDLFSKFLFWSDSSLLDIAREKISNGTGFVEFFF